MADLPAKIFMPMSGRRSVFFNEQPLRSGLSGSLPPPQQGFTDDPTTISLYQFEGAFLLTDSIGTSDLTNQNGVTANEIDAKEASFSASFTASSFFTVADVNQSSDYPLKNGQNNKVFTITGWFKLDNTTGPKVIWGKGDDVNRSVQFAILANGNLGYRVHTGVTFEDNDFGVSLTPGVWYHHGLEADHDAKVYRLVLWNDTTSSETIVIASGTIEVTTPAAPWSWAATGTGAENMTGLMDEYSMTGRILGVPDIRQIREGVYDGPLSVRETQFGVQTLVVSPNAPVRLSQFGIQVLIAAPSGIVRATQYGIQVLHLSAPEAIKVFPVIPPERVFESQAGKRVFPLP